jgi:hypothetical protein
MVVYITYLSDIGIAHVKVLGEAQVIMKSFRAFRTVRYAELVGTTSLSRPTWFYLLGTKATGLSQPPQPHPPVS